MKYLFLICFLFISLKASSLEIDEKLTVRLLKVSKSKKTVLVNRGLEDGLVVGDHAKFFLTTGVFARGVVIKASPGRTVWSLYRVVDGDQVTTDKVSNIKISTPLKITEDPSKMIYNEAIAEAGSDTIDIPVAEGAEEPVANSSSDKKEIEDLKGESQSSPTVSRSSRGLRNRTWEVYGTLQFNSLSGEYTTSDVSSEAKSSAVDFSLGVEKYWWVKSETFRRFSILGLFHKRNTTSGSGSVEVSQDWTEFGLGANYHFYNTPFDASVPVFYGGFTFGLGSLSTTTTTTGTTSSESELSGSSSFYSFAVGMKYFIPSGFGAKVVLDYYITNESYEFDDGTTQEGSLSGPRIQVGLSYRF